MKYRKNVNLEYPDRLLPVFTDRERLKIYKMALEYHLKAVENSLKKNTTTTGLCLALGKILAFERAIFTMEDLVYILPEFGKLKKNRLYWWSTRNYTIRATKLRNIIKELELKIERNVKKKRQR
jgi:hypothetical protein